MTMTSSIARTVVPTTTGALNIVVGFKVQRSDDLRVYRTPSGGTATLLTLGTHYSISQLGESTALVALVTAAAAGDVYVLLSDVEYLQELDLRNQGAYLPETLETAGLDRIVRMIQQIESVVGTDDQSLSRALLLALGDVIGSGAYDALSNRIKNLTNGTGAQDAVTLSQMQAAIAGIVGGGSGSTRVIVTAATLPVAGIAYDFAATGIEYIVRDAGFPDVIKRCLRLSTGNTYDWFVVVQGDV